MFRDAGSSARGLRAAIIVLTCVVLLGLPGEGSPQWQSAGRLNVPTYPYLFLAASPQGDLLAATFNSQPAGESGRQMPALLIRHPGTERPEVIELCRIHFQPQRGYGGIASDPYGDLYVSGDTGDVGTSFVRKFRKDGSPDTRFGRNGEIRPNRRTLGVDVIGRYLFVAVDWGEVLIFDASTGAQMGTVPKAPGTVYVRDIAVDPRSMRVFGVAKGSVVVWHQGAPWNAGAYRFHPLTPARGELRAGEGISIDPVRGTALITPAPGNILREIAVDGSESTTLVASANPDTHLADSVMSFDGRTLYISDMIAQSIHLLRRQTIPTAPGRTAGSAVARGTASPAATPVHAAEASAPAPRPTWHRSYTQIVQTAREQQRPMIVYFGRQDVDKCREFQQNVLLSDAFNQRAAPYVCVYEDVTHDLLTAYRFGAYRIPHLVVLDRRGETVAQFTFDIDPDRLFAVMEANR